MEEIVSDAVEYRPFNLNDAYRIGTDGSVWSKYIWGHTKIGNVWRILTPCPRGDGYLTVRMKVNGLSKNYAVHRLVLETFRGPCPEGMEGAHDNGIATDNRLSNLFWKTWLENYKDKIRHGTSPHKLTIEQENQLYKLRLTGLTFVTLGKIYGIGKTSAIRINKRAKQRLSTP